VIIARSPINEHIHISIELSVTLPSSVFSPTPSSNCPAILITRMLIVIITGTFARDKSFGLVDIDQRELEGNTVVGRTGKASSALIPTKTGSLNILVAT
jgi:hypothetical protein